MDIEIIVRKIFHLLISYTLLGPSRCLYVGLQLQDRSVEILELYDLFIYLLIFISYKLQIELN